ncbi:MAG TPA: nucleotidyltransferase family protein [Bacteroidales bacterium]|nr:nucleotidyltransferase family protein [Bacteroidales bacterium]
MIATLTKEELLIIKLCRLTFSDDEKAEIRKLAAAITGWDNFTKLVNIHGISALVYNNLEKQDHFDFVPEKNRFLLRKSRILSMARNATMMHQLEGAISIAGVKTVLLKGAALELMIYGNTGLRQMNDVDVLMTREDSLRSFRLLEKSGYEPLPVKSVFHRLIIDHIGKHLPSLIKGGLSIELHHDLFDLAASDLTRFFYETSVERSAGSKLFIPEPCIFFLYLVRHLEKHEQSDGSQLRLYTDLVVMIAKYGDTIINDRLIEYSGIAGLNKALASKLKIIREIFSVSYPDWMNEFVDANCAADANERFYYFLRNPRNHLNADRKGNYQKTIKNIKGIHRKALFVIGDLFPTIAFMKQRYKCKSGLKSLLYYPHRWGKLGWLVRR